MIQYFSCWLDKLKGERLRITTKIPRFMPAACTKTEIVDTICTSTTVIFLAQRRLIRSGGTNTTVPGQAACTVVEEDRGVCVATIC